MFRLTVHARCWGVLPGYLLPHSLHYVKRRPGGTAAISRHPPAFLRWNAMKASPLPGGAHPPFVYRSETFLRPPIVLGQAPTMRLALGQMRAKLCWFALALSAGPISPPAAPPASIADLRRAFAPPPDDSRPMMRWWWFGPAVTTPELEREMRLMKEGGIGGFEVQPVYPLALDDSAKGFRNLPYLSPEFLDALKFAGAKAKELGLRMDLTLASGWPYGGPHIP